MTDNQIAIIIVFGCVVLVYILFRIMWLDSEDRPIREVIPGLTARHRRQFGRDQIRKRYEKDLERERKEAIRYISHDDFAHLKFWKWDPEYRLVWDLSDHGYKYDKYFKAEDKERLDRYGYSTLH